MKRTKVPVILTVNGNADCLCWMPRTTKPVGKRTIEWGRIEGIKRGLESMKRKRGTPATEFFREYFAEKGIPQYK